MNITINDYINITNWEGKNSQWSPKIRSDKAQRALDSGDSSPLSSIFLASSAAHPEPRLVFARRSSLRSRSWFTRGYVALFYHFDLAIRKPVLLHRSFLG